MPFTRSAFDAVNGRKRALAARPDFQEIVKDVALFLLTLEVIYVALAVVLFLLVH